MAKHLTNKVGKVRELTAADMKKFRPIQEVDPRMLEVVAANRKDRDSQKKRIGKGELS